MAKDPSVQSIIVPRKTVDTTRFAGQGAESFANVAGGFASFFGSQMKREIQEQEELDRVDAVNLSKELPLLLRNNPDAAKAFKRTGDLKSFLKTTGRKGRDTMFNNAGIMNSVMGNAGKSMGAAAREGLTEALKNADPSTPYSVVRDEFLKSHADQFTDPTMRSGFLGSLEEFGKGEVSKFRKSRTDSVNVEHMNSVRSNARDTLKNDPLKPESAATALQSITDGYRATGLDNVTASLKAKKDLDLIALRGIRAGEAYGDALANTPDETGKSPMDNPVFAEEARKAKQIHLKTLDDQNSEEEVQSLASVEDGIAQYERGELTLNEAVAMFRSHREKYRESRGLPLSTRGRSVRSALQKALKSGAKKNVDMNSTFTMLSVDGSLTNKQKEIVESPEFIAELMLRNTGMTHEQALSQQTRFIAQNGGGNSKEQRGLNTTDLLRTDDPDRTIATATRILQLERAAADGKDGEGRFYNETADAKMDFLREKMLGVAPEEMGTNLKVALKQYEEALERNGGPPSEKFLRDMGITRPKLDGYTRQGLSKLADKLGMDEGSLGGVSSILRKSLINVIWANSNNLEGGIPTDSIYDEAARHVQRKVKVSIGTDADGDPTMTVVGAGGVRTPPLNEKQEDEATTALQELPESLNENGTSLTEDDQSANDGSFQVNRKDLAGGTAPIQALPGTKLEVTPEEAAGLYKNFTRVEERPLAGEDGAVTIQLPTDPAPGTWVEGENGMDWYSSKDGVWQLRYRSGPSKKRISTVQEFEEARAQQLKDEEEKIVEHSANTFGFEPGADAPPKELIPRIDEDSQANKRDGSWLENTPGSPLRIVTDITTKEGSVLSQTPISRKTNTPQSTGDDRIVGYGFNLDRADANDTLEAVGLDPKMVRSGKQRVSREDAENLAKISSQNTAKNLRQRLGEKDFNDLNAAQLSAMILLVETGKFNKDGKSAVLTPRLIQELKRDDWRGVAQIIDSTVMQVEAEAEDDDDRPSMSQLQQWANRPGGRMSMSEAAQEIRLRNAERPEGGRTRADDVASITTQAARDRARRAFRAEEVEALGKPKAPQELPPKPASKLDTKFGEKQTSRFEGGFHKTVYLDSANPPNPTVGIGFNLNRKDAAKKLRELGMRIDDVKSGRRELSKDEATVLFRQDYKQAQVDANKFAGSSTFDKLSGPRKQVIVDMAFNMGLTKLNDFTNFKAALKAGDFQAAAEAMKNSKWFNQVGTRSEELVQQMIKG